MSTEVLFAITSQISLHDNFSKRECISLELHHKVPYHQSEVGKDLRCCDLYNLRIKGQKGAIGIWLNPYPISNV